MSDRPKVLLDTNVLVSGVLGSPLCRRILHLCNAQEILLVSSRPLINEFLDVIARPKCSHLVDHETLKLLMRIMEFQALLVQPTVVVRDAPDPKDAIVLEALRTSHAEVLVTSDRQLLALRSYAEATVLPPNQFLSWIERRLP